MSDKLPALQFYPGDWRRDVGVQSLSFHDRGVWFEMVMLMHGSEVRGKLILNGKPIPEDALCRLLGLDNQTQSRIGGLETICNAVQIPGARPPTQTKAPFSSSVNLSATAWKLIPIKVLDLLH